MGRSTLQHISLTLVLNVLFFHQMNWLSSVHLPLDPPHLQLETHTNHHHRGQLLLWSQGHHDRYLGSCQCLVGTPWHHSHYTKSFLYQPPEQCYVINNFPWELINNFHVSSTCACIILIIRRCTNDLYTTVPRSDYTILI